MNTKNALIIVLIFFVSLPLTARRSIMVEWDTFTGKGKSIELIPTCDACIEDNNKELTICFKKTIGNVSITVSDINSGEVIYSGDTVGTAGGIFIIGFDDELNTGSQYSIGITNGVQLFYGIFY